MLKSSNIKENMKDIILKKLNDAKNVFNKSETNGYDVWMYGNIPSKKEFNAKEAHGFPIKSEILWLSDLTLFGSAKDNLVFTEEGIFFHESTFGDSTYLKIKWEKLIRVEYHEGNESLWFVMSEEDEQQNIYLQLTKFIFSCKHVDIPIIVNILNSIAESAEDKEYIALIEIWELERNGGGQELISACDSFLDEYPKSPNAYHIYKAKSFVYYDSLDWESAQYYLQKTLGCFADDRSEERRVGKECR